MFLLFGDACEDEIRPDAGSIYSAISMWSGEQEQWSSLVVHLYLPSELT
jgi:hypothetical protein